MRLEWYEALMLGALIALGMYLSTRRKRNRWLPTPRKDDRSSIEYSKPHMPQGTRR